MLGVTMKRALFRADMASARGRRPRKVMPGIFRSRTRASSAARSGPSPMMCSGHGTGETLPRVQQRRQTLFRGQSPVYRSVVADSRSRARIPVDEIRFDGDLGRLKTRADEFFAREIRQRNVTVDGVVPGSQTPVRSQNQGERRGGGFRISIASVANAAPEAVIHTFFANFAIREIKLRTGTSI